MAFPRDNWWTRFRDPYALWAISPLFVSNAQLRRNDPRASMLFWSPEVGERWN